MSELSVIILAPDDEHRSILQIQVDATAVARSIYAFPSFPLGTTDMILRRMQDMDADVVLVDIPRSDSGSALHAIELIHSEVPKSAIFAVGETSQPQTIIAAMRAGAREFLERPTTTNHLLEAFVRLTSSHRKSQKGTEHGKVFTVIGAKGGCGTTTVAVNTALALQQSQKKTVLVDFAPLGHAALHLNAKHSFTIADALRNAHRLDASLLEGYMTRCEGGLQLLAGTAGPSGEEYSSTDLARLFDLLVSNYRHVIVDASTRLDQVTRVLCELSERVLMVGTVDVTSLWSAAKVHDYLGETLPAGRLRLVLNRFRKIPGFSDSEVEATTRTKLIFKLANQYAAISASIDRGVPVTQQNHSEIARSFTELAQLLDPKTKPVAESRGFSLFRKS